MNKTQGSEKSGPFKMQNAESRMQNYWNCVGYNNAFANNKSIVVNAFMRSANFTIKNNAKPYNVRKRSFPDYMVKFLLLQK